MGGRVSTIHIIDWLGSPEHRAVGMSLMRLAHQGVATQFGLGVSQAALVVGERAGYDLRSLVPVYTRVVRAGYWLRAGALSPWQRGLRPGPRCREPMIRPAKSPRATIAARRVSSFGPEIIPIVDSAGEHAILTTRDPGRLNAFLDFPRQAMSGWHLLDDAGRLRGFAVLNVIPKDGGRTRTGKVVDCLLDDVDVDLWHAAFFALTGELKPGRRHGPGVRQHALGRRGACAGADIVSRYSVKFHIRDRQGLIPRE